MFLGNLVNSNEKNKLELKERFINNYNYFFECRHLYIGKSKILDESINYYFGIFEYAIYLLKRYDLYGDCEKEKYLARYFKNMFFNDIQIEESILRKTIRGLINDSCDWYLVIVYMIYPDYYFKLVDDFINFSKLDEVRMYQVVGYRDLYKKYLNLFVTELNVYKKIEISIY